MIDRRLVGITTAPTCVPVDAWRVKLFCQAIGETDPLYWDDAAARAAVSYKPEALRINCAASPIAWLVKPVSANASIRQLSRTSRYFMHSARPAAVATKNTSLPIFSLFT